MDVYGHEGVGLEGAGVETSRTSLDSSEARVRSDDWGGVDGTHAPRVRCATTQGDIVIQVRPAWAPLGAERFLALVRDGEYFSANGGIGLFRTVQNFITQFGKWYRLPPSSNPHKKIRQTGVPGDPAVYRRVKAWGRIPDDKQWLDMDLKKR